jgi:hypothetical protein
MRKEGRKVKEKQDHIKKMNRTEQHIVQNGARHNKLSKAHGNQRQ